MKRRFSFPLLAFLLLLQTGSLHRSISQASTGTSQSKTAAMAPRYEIVDLGVLSLIATDVVPGLSDNGKSTTWRQVDSESFTAVLHDGATERLLPPPPGYHNSFAYSVNNRGNSAGWCNTTVNPVDSASTVHATCFRKTRTVDLGTLGGRNSRAYAINDGDVIVGVSDLAGKTQSAFRYSKGRMTALDPLPGSVFSVAFDINQLGSIVGGSEVASTSSKKVMRAVLWRGNKPQDLGALREKGNSIAYAINNLEDVVGVADGRSGETVFLYSRGKITDLEIEGRAFGINDQRQVVGSLAPAERGRPRGFLWENGTSYDLNRLIPDHTYRIEVAYRINNRRQILCSGFGSGQLHALLLSPVN